MELLNLTRPDSVLGRELLLPGGLDVLELVHGLAELGEFPVHPHPRPVGVSQGSFSAQSIPQNTSMLVLVVSWFAACPRLARPRGVTHAP